MCDIAVTEIYTVVYQELRYNASGDSCMGCICKEFLLDLRE